MIFDGFEVLTLDCYGTLIDWENGILDALRPLYAAHNRDFDPREVLAAFAELEPRIQSGDYLRYRDVLLRVMEGFSARYNIPFSPEEIASLAKSVSAWRPYPDTVPALRQLKRKYQMGIISNIDDDMFAASAQQLEVPFDFVITAQQVRSYKPSLRNFEEALTRIGRPKEKVLHVAESLFHDIEPANRLGLKSIWVNRRATTGQAASKVCSASPDMTVLNMKELADAACAN